jgi:hypothetical protein
MVLENVKEMWTETPRLANGKKGRPVNKDRFISKMYVYNPITYQLAVTGTSRLSADFITGSYEAIASFWFFSANGSLPS